jgi:ribosomal protein S18 acetylase RimI-like enzyme
MAIIGHATVRSAPGIAKVYVDTWRSTYAGLLPDRVLLGMSYERQANEWAWVIRNRSDSQSVMVAAEVGHGVVAMASLGHGRTADLPPSGPFAPSGGAIGEIYTLYVLPEFQERGIGRQLLAAAFSALVSRCIDRAYCWTLVESKGARSFYARYDGKEIRKKKQKLWGVDVHQVAYGWTDLKATISKLGPFQLR